jgi:hypothetical protein
MDSLLSLSGSVMSATAASSSLKSATISASSQSDRYLKSYVDAGSENIINNNATLLEQHRGDDKERKQLERKAATKLKSAGSIVTQLESLKGKMSQNQEQFNQLKIYFQDSIALNKDSSTQSEGKSSKGIDKNLYDAGTNSLSGMDVFYGGLAEVVSGMIEKVYQTEYIVNYFQHFDISTMDELLRDGGTEKIEKLTQRFASDQQEVEYILYGFYHPSSNIAAAYSEIFAMRLAIRTMEGFIKNVNKGNPLLILALALLYGVEKAVSDMLLLSQKGSIPLSDFIKVEITYRDHLRMFLFLHGGSKERLSRMLSVIRFNTGVDPGKRNTYVKGEVTTGMVLWFLPGVAKAMGAMNILNGRVEGSRYFVQKQSHFSY